MCAETCWHGWAAFSWYVDDYWLHCQPDGLTDNVLISTEHHLSMYPGLSSCYRSVIGLSLFVFTTATCLGTTSDVAASSYLWTSVGLSFPCTLQHCLWECRTIPSPGHFPGHLPHPRQFPEQLPIYLRTLDIHSFSLAAQLKMWKLALTHTPYPTHSTSVNLTHVSGRSFYIVDGRKTPALAVLRQCCFRNRHCWCAIKLYQWNVNTYVYNVSSYI